MRKLLQINPVLRTNTSTGRIMQEIGELAMQHGWESYIAYSGGRDGIKPCQSQLLPVGNKWDVVWHGLMTRMFDKHGLASKQATYALIDQIEKLHPDLIHIHNIHGYFLNYKLFFHYLSHKNIPVVWTVHDCWLYTGHCYYYSFIGCSKWQTGCHHCPQQRKFPASLFADRSARNWVDKKEAFTSLPTKRLTIVPVSEWIKDEMQNSFFKDYAFRVIHNGINTAVFGEVDSTDIKRKYELTGKHVLLGIASIWSEEKGWKDFLQLAKLLNEREVIVMVGVNPKEKRQLPKNMIGISRTENVHQLAALYAAADVLVNPTWQDNYPTVNLEAIACGTPVVTYRTGGSVEAITEQTGMIVEQGDVNGLMRAVRIIEDRGKSYYRKACSAYALAHFKKEDRYADYLKLYDELVNRK